MLAAPAWRFVCCTESVAEGKEPVETDGKKPEPTGPEPLQAVVAQEQNAIENGSNQREPSRVGVNEQAESSSPAVKEGTCSPPPAGKYAALIKVTLSHVSISVEMHEFYRAKATKIGCES